MPSSMIVVITLSLSAETASNENSRSTSNNVIFLLEIRADINLSPRGSPEKSELIKVVSPHQMIPIQTTNSVVRFDYLLSLVALFPKTSL